MLSSRNVSRALHLPVSATDAEINTLEKRNVREECYHLYRPALALQDAGTARCLACPEPRSRYHHCLALRDICVRYSEPNALMAGGQPTKEAMQQRIQQFAGQGVTDLAAAMAGVMTNLGHKLGLYRTMAESGPINSDELARRTSTNERSLREWLNGQVAGGYVRFDSRTNQYLLPA